MFLFVIKILDMMESLSWTHKRIFSGMHTNTSIQIGLDAWCIGMYAWHSY